MKKLFITIVMAFMAVTGYAQTTFNVRVGGGFFQTYVDDYYDYGTEPHGGATLTFEANIPLGARTNKFVFSPSVSVISDITDGANINVPLHFGYKVPLGNGSVFIPKIGPMVGYYAAYSTINTLAVGPSTEFSFETNHFVIAANCYVDLIEEVKFGVFGTIGYKF